ncbi:MAG: DUF302 domain-containing protein [Hyphomicrobium sp.]|uniref:DUF302 domain-containing protein n=1 Tax=Hyphomicrobium sp. TaxID=82 RepID=UPI003D0F9B48
MSFTLSHFASMTGAAVVAAAAMSWFAGTTVSSAPSSDGLVKVRSAYAMDETVTRLKADIENKGIKFFLAVDQAELGASAGITLNPSTLLIFGNPPLGIQFLTSNPNAGLDWPVRLLVNQDDQGQVWATYTDFAWIAHRHGIDDRGPQFRMASEVIASITSSVSK